MHTYAVCLSTYKTVFLFLGWILSTPSTPLPKKTAVDPITAHFCQEPEGLTPS
jgi:hypothetical protein